MKDINSIISNTMDAMICDLAFRMAIRDFLRDHPDALDNDQKKAEAEEKPHVHFSNHEKKKEEGMNFMDLLRKLRKDDGPDTVSEDSNKR